MLQTMRTMQKILNELTNSIIRINERLDFLEKKVESNEYKGVARCEEWDEEHYAE